MTDINGLARKPHIHGRCESLTFDQYISSPIINGAQFPNAAYNALSVIGNGVNPGYLYYDGTEFSLGSGGSGGSSGVTAQNATFQYKAGGVGNDIPVKFTKLDDVVHMYIPGFSLSPGGTVDHVSLIPNVGLSATYAPITNNHIFSVVLNIDGVQQSGLVSLFTNGTLEFRRLGSADITSTFVLNGFLNLSFIQ